MQLMINILIMSVIIFVLAKILPAVHIKSFWTAVIVAIVYGIINVLLGWLLVMITLPAVILTFGLFKLVINAILLWITDKIVEDFRIETFGWTLITALLITVLDSAVKWLFFA